MHGVVAELFPIISAETHILLMLSVRYEVG